MILYILVGVLWSWWLEWFTTNNLPGIAGKSWVWRERIFHSLLWPVSLGVFIYNLLFP
jgi:hypothetical protein